MEKEKILGIAEEYSEVVLEDINEGFYQEIDNFYQGSREQHLTQIKKIVDKLITSMEMYNIQIKINKGDTINQKKEKMEKKRQEIYDDFFQLQNLINLFLRQKIIMTYVHVSETTGERELRIFDNNISNLVAKTDSFRGREYAKLEYEVNERYLQLKNSLSDNMGLQMTAQEVEKRYAKHKGFILWKINNENFGYKLTNRGPINEAFTDFYLKEIQLKNSLNENLHQFMLSEDPKGVVRADNANGFLIGDVSLGGLQFAVKGKGGGPQSFFLIIKWLKQLKEQDFSDFAFKDFIERFKDIEEEKARNIVKPLLKKDIAKIIEEYGEEILNNLSS